MPGFWGCKWCHGTGCLSCDAEQEKEYKRQFPDGPKPIAMFRLDSEESMAAARKTLSADALAKAFGPGGGGVGEIEQNFKEAMNINDGAQ